MEEKERYIIDDYDYIFDNEKNMPICDLCNIFGSYKIIDLLNQQYKENQQLKQQLNIYKLRYNSLEEKLKNFDNNILKSMQIKIDEIKNLKQQLENEKNTSAELVSLIDTMRYEDPKINELEKQLHDLPKKIVGEIKNSLLDFSNGWWRYFLPDTGYYMLSRDLEGCLGETIDTILKKYGGENESNND
ncbi:MAG: hypothetical protein ACI4PF_06375 [Christensenellales bacterium]